MAQTNAKRTLKKAEVLKATKIPLHTFQNWFDRRAVKLTGDDVSTDTPGKPRGFGLRTIVKLAIAHRVSLLGIPATAAVALAETFTDKPQVGRELGQPFKTGRTFLFSVPDGTCKIVNVQGDQDISEHFQDATIIVDVGLIVEETLSRISVIK